MGNKKVRTHELQVLLMTPQLPRSAWDAHLLLDQTAQLDCAKVDVLNAAVNLFEANILAGAEADIHPVTVSADAAVVAA